MRQRRKVVLALPAIQESWRPAHFFLAGNHCPSGAQRQSCLNYAPERMSGLYLLLPVSCLTSYFQQVGMVLECMSKGGKGRILLAPVSFTRASVIVVGQARVEGEYLSKGHQHNKRPIFLLLYMSKSGSSTCTL